MTATLIFPSPAVIETLDTATLDPVTQTPEGNRSVRYAPHVVATPQQDGTTLVAWEEDGGDQVRESVLASLTQEAEDVVGSTTEGVEFRFRPADPYDAVVMSTAGVPQPIEVVQAQIIRGAGQLAQELDALVASDNTVATLMLETGLGVYVRFSGDWQLLDSSSDSLEDLSVVEVAPSALDVFDSADAAGTTLTISDLPTETSDEQDNVVLYPVPESQATGMTVEDEPVTASGTSIPQVDGPEDLPLALRYAQSHPEARWYVVKRAVALGRTASVPQDWLTPDLRVPGSVEIDLSSADAVRASAVDLFLLQRSGRSGPLEHLFIQSLIAGARRFGIMDDPTLVAALNWRDWMHPRGRDGKFINKLAKINVFKNLGGSENSEKRRAVVDDLTPDGIEVRYTDGKPDSPDFPTLIPVDQASRRIESATKAQATLSDLDDLTRNMIGQTGLKLGIPPTPDSPPDVPATKVRADESELIKRYIPDLRHNAESTGALHTVEQPDGSFDFTPERKALHEKIISHFMDGKRPVPQGQQASYAVLGGGPAAGKSTLVKSGLFPELQDPNSIEINADEIKGQLPEYSQMLNSSDPATRLKAASLVHEESSYLTQLLMLRSLDGNYNAVLDGTGDSSATTMLAKLNEARRRGYKVNGYYTTVPVNDAMSRMIARGDKTGRYVPPGVLINTHRGVSKVLPQIYDQFDNVGLYDTTQRGQATPIMTAKKGEPQTVLDSKLWDDFLAKADNESDKDLIGYWQKVMDSHANEPEQPLGLVQNPDESL